MTIYADIERLISYALVEAEGAPVAEADRVQAWLNNPSWYFLDSEHPLDLEEEQDEVTELDPFIAAVRVAGLIKEEG
jgi:hypothetical protein